ncbi:MAG: M6 family metalloprotease domain-containing protein [Muribaculaceae bacterium]|nr:M6 family metalloprotease domain-containing protein [Muribaculaceae bacterium]
MKRILFFLLSAAALLVAKAVPADPTPVQVTQPDGETVTLKLVGDEFYHYNITTDGYTVVNYNGRWEYATLKNNRLAPSGVLAHDAVRRSANELAFVAQLKRYTTDRQAVSTAKINRTNRDRKLAPSKEPVVDYSSFRGLIVLINFTDKEFQMEDAHAFYDDMMNTQNYEGFNFDGRFNPCTGSVRDYFHDQSMGQFDPVFDVAGPVTVPFSVRECGEHYDQVFKAALDSIDSFVDFTQYDSDNDGGVDMVFFLVAGYAASYQGNSEDYLWPHMSFLFTFDEQTGWWSPLFYDSMMMGRYASSTEIYGWESYGMTMPNGIGTVCHEFSHVLGLPDLYDTDYEEHGQSNDPGEWDVMAGGSYGNMGRTPVGYSLWERWELGWTEPEQMTLGEHELHAIDQSNTGIIMQSPVDEEFFLFENRQRNKWDRSLPGHGMLVTRVDYSNPRVWRDNSVNCNPSHNYYELVRAGGGAEATAFPGPTGATSLTATTNPALITWAGVPCEWAIKNIAENDRVITFNCQEGEPTKSIVEDFEIMPVTDNLSEKGIEGRFANWDFINSNVMQNNVIFGDNSCSMGMPGAINMVDDIDADIYMISIQARNESSQESKLQLYYSLDKGGTWKTVSAIAVKGNTTEEIRWRINMEKPARYRITRISGNKNVPLIVDDFTIHYTGELRPIAEGLLGDIDNSGIIDVEDVNAAINIILKIKNMSDYPGNGDMDGNGYIDVEDVNAIINIILKL